MLQITIPSTEDQRNIPRGRSPAATKLIKEAMETLFFGRKSKSISGRSKS
jgi:hypothetical protein